MITLMTAALVAAQPAPVANPHAHHAQMAQQGQMAPMQHDQHEGMKKDCCKDCCKGMKKGEHDEHAKGAQPHRGE